MRSSLAWVGRLTQVQPVLQHWHRTLIAVTVELAAQPALQLVFMQDHTDIEQCHHSLLHNLVLANGHLGFRSLL